MGIRQSGGGGGGQAAAAGAPAPGTPAYNSAWYALTTIYWDPAGTAGGSDSNSGSTSGAPVLTWGEILRRYGSISPLFAYAQTVQINMLSAQPAGQDSVWLDPLLSGGGHFVLNGVTAWVAAGANFTLSATPTGGYGFSGAAVSAGGTAMTITSVPAYVAVGQVLQNTTRTSYARVLTVAGGTATLSQPFTVASVTQTTAIPSPVVDNDWASGDTISVWNLPNINLESFSPRGGDLSAGAVPSAGWLIGVSVSDSSGTGASVLLARGRTAIITFSECHFACRLHLSTDGGRGNSSYFIGCTFAQAVLSQSGGAASTFGCGWLTSSSLTAYTAYVWNFFNNNVFVTATSTVFHSGAQAVINASGIMTNHSFLAEYGGVIRIVGASGLWGAPVVQLIIGAQCSVNGTTFANGITTNAAAPLLLESASTGTTAPTAVSTFTLNGVTQVNVTGTFPSNAPILISLNTVGSTPGTGAPYFSQAQTANNFFIKSPTASANDVYNWSAGAASGVNLTLANVDTYTALLNPRTGSRFTTGV